VNRNNFDLIVFDWDGTLFDSTATIVTAIQNAARDLSVRVPSREQAAYVIGLGLQDALRHAVPELPESRYMELAMRYRHHYLADEEQLTLFEGAQDMLHALKDAGYMLAVATGKSRLGLDRALATTGLKPLFDITRTADQTRSKPHPQMLEEILEETGAPKLRTLMVGDTTHDMQLAQNAGTHAAAVTYGAHDPAPLLEFSPRVCAHSVPELREWLRLNG
jgi:phosphoglycolate phosphatase